ncbi:barstar family protein [Streptomyces zhihengii]
MFRIRGQGPNGLVVRLDGRELRDPASVFRTFARELSFLDSFGYNWDALVDCLHDWHGPGHGNQDLAILIEHADDLLNADFLGLFVSVLAQAAWSSNLRLDGDGVPDEWRQRIAQHFIFLLDHTAPVAFIEKVARGIDVAVALSDGRLLVTLTDVDWPGGDSASAPWTAGTLSQTRRSSAAETSRASRCSETTSAARPTRPWTSSGLALSSCATTIQTAT